MEEKKPLSVREQKALERSEKAQERENQEKRTKAEYHKIRSSEALEDLTAKMVSFRDYYTKIAQDGMAGTDKGEVVNLSPEQRLTSLDKAAGIQVIIDYLERKLTIEPVISKKEKDNEQDRNEQDWGH